MYLLPLVNFCHFGELHTWILLSDGSLELMSTLHHYAEDECLTPHSADLETEITMIIMDSHQCSNIILFDEAYIQLSIDFYTS